MHFRAFLVGCCFSFLFLLPLLLLPLVFVFIVLVVVAASCFCSCYCSSCCCGGGGGRRRCLVVLGCDLFLVQRSLVAMIILHLSHYTVLASTQGEVVVDLHILDMGQSSVITPFIGW
jgi:hypothetical protein